nr:hypothetical protein [Angustibacter aerolatus]
MPERPGAPLRLAAVPASAGAARRFVRDRLEGGLALLGAASDDVLDTVRLVVTEPGDERGAARPDRPVAAPGAHRRRRAAGGRRRVTARAGLAAAHADGHHRPRLDRRDRADPRRRRRGRAGRRRQGRVVRDPARRARRPAAGLVRDAGLGGRRGGRRRRTRPAASGGHPAGDAARCRRGAPTGRGCAGCAGCAGDRACPAWAGRCGSSASPSPARCGCTSTGRRWCASSSLLDLAGTPGRRTSGPTSRRSARAARPVHRPGHPGRRGLERAARAGLAAVDLDYPPAADPDGFAAAWQRLTERMDDLSEAAHLLAVPTPLEAQEAHRLGARRVRGAGRRPPAHPVDRASGLTCADCSGRGLLGRR